MSVVFGTLGLLILVSVLGDVVRTTLSTKGAGIISSFVASSLWSGALAYHRRRTSHKLLSFMGVFILVAIIGVWTFLLWLGWSLLFSVDPGGVVLASSGEPAGIVETFYFAGYTLITLGNGEYRPEGPFWQLMTLLASTTGFFVVTLSITFLLSVLPAVVAKRQLSSYVDTLGRTPEAIALHDWNARPCRALESHLSTLISSINGLAQQHLAFPVLHYFHTTDLRTALPLRIAALDESLSYLKYGLPRCEGSEQLEPLRESVESLLDTLQTLFYEAEDDAPPLPSLEPFRERGLNVAEASEFAQRLNENRSRRRHLLGYLKRDGWEWKDIYRTEDSAE